MLKRIRAILLTLVLLSLSFMSMFEDAYAREPYYAEGEFLAYDIT